MQENKLLLLQNMMGLSMGLYAPLRAQLIKKISVPSEDSKLKALQLLMGEDVMPNACFYLSGPARFVTLRVGAALGMGYAQGMGIEAFGIKTLEALAYAAFLKRGEQKQKNQGNYQIFASFGLRKGYQSTMFLSKDTFVLKEEGIWASVDLSKPFSIFYEKEEVLIDEDWLFFGMALIAKKQKTLLPSGMLTYIRKEL